MENILKYRKMKNLTQIELAKMLNVDRQLFKGNRGALPTADKLPKIAKALNCKIDDLF